ncbi:MAG: hypothetical protein IT348_06365 [Candidatus Eisenbacteria bacterium]|nr:hypothetical protein [Candidatus Eisenbacteria bacterium]
MMKRAMVLLLLASLSLAGSPVEAAAGRAPVNARAQALSRAILGTWQLVWPEVPADERELKLITPTHFTWTTWKTTTHQVLATGGGPYTLVGSDYCEQVSFALGGVENVAGQVLCFEVQVKGDTLLQIGPRGPDGGRSREVWKRVR